MAWALSSIEMKIIQTQFQFSVGLGSVPYRSRMGPSDYDGTRSRSRSSRSGALRHPHGYGTATDAVVRLLRRKIFSKSRKQRSRPPEGLQSTESHLR